MDVFYISTDIHHSWLFVIVLTVTGLLSKEQRKLKQLMHISEYF